MTTLRVKFCNKLANSTGHDFHCCQRAIEVQVDHDRELAIEEAKRRFEQLERVALWTLRASSIECEEIA